MVEVKPLSAISQEEELFSSSTVVLRCRFKGGFIVNSHAHNVSVFQEGDGEVEMSSLRRARASRHPFELVSC